METAKPSTFKSALPYGLSIGAASVVYSLLLYSLGLMENKVMGMLSVIILIVGIVLGILDFRNKKNGGYASFGQAFLVGLYIGIIAGVVGSIYSYLFFQFFDPGMIQTMLQKAEEEMMNKYPNMSEEQLATVIKMQAKWMTPPIMAAMSLVMNTLFTTIISLILGAFLKKEDKSFDSNFQ